MSDYIPNPFNAEVDDDIRIAVIRAEWNGHITRKLADSALETYKSHGLDESMVSVYDVPGAIELTFGASQAIETGLFDAVIVFGCVIRGETPHFDYVCQSVTQGITHLNAECDIPVIFGVLTVENEQQALERLGGKHGDKGAEAMDAALKMVGFRRTLSEL